MGLEKIAFSIGLWWDFPLLQEVVTYTTRKPRHQETPGEDYHFLSPSAFKAKIGEGFFAEWSMVHDCFYGTSHESLQQVWDQGHVAIMDIDVQGVEKMKKLYPQAMSLFILPPSMEELKRRILLRDQQAPEEFGSYAFKMPKKRWNRPMVLMPRSSMMILRKPMGSLRKSLLNGSLFNRVGACACTSHKVCEKIGAKKEVFYGSCHC